MVEERIYCIRGAVCSENNASDITEKTGLLCKTIFEKNHVAKENIVSIQFTMTPDLDELNPATGLRRYFSNNELSNIPLFCSAEPVVKNMKAKVIRTMITVYLPKDSVIQNIYLNGAETLRPDLAKSKTRNC